MYGEGLGQTYDAGPIYAPLTSAKPWWQQLLDIGKTMIPSITGQQQTAAPSSTSLWSIAAIALGAMILVSITKKRSRS